MSSSAKASGCADWIVIAPMAWPRLISGSASLERVAGSSGFFSRAASSVTSSSRRDWRLAMHQPTMESPPTVDPAPLRHHLPASLARPRAQHRPPARTICLIDKIEADIVQPEPLAGQLHHLVDQFVGIEDAARGA